MYKSLNDLLIKHKLSRRKHTKEYFLVNLADFDAVDALSWSETKQKSWRKDVSLDSSSRLSAEMAKSKAASADNESVSDPDSLSSDQEGPPEQLNALQGAMSVSADVEEELMAASRCESVRATRLSVIPEGANSALSVSSSANFSKSMRQIESEKR